MCCDIAGLGVRTGTAADAADNLRRTATTTPTVIMRTTTTPAEALMVVIFFVSAAAPAAAASTVLVVVLKVVVVVVMVVVTLPCRRRGVIGLYRPHRCKEATTLTEPSYRMDLYPSSSSSSAVLSPD